MVSDELKTLVDLIVSEDLMRIFINVTNSSLVNSTVVISVTSKFEDGSIN